MAADLRAARPQGASGQLVNARYIVGAWQPWSASFNTAWVTLVCNGARANHAALEEALNGPEEAARWMWQEAGMRGFPLGDQTLFLTGACGRAVPAEIGEYTADYGALGSLSFVVV